LHATSGFGGALGFAAAGATRDESGDANDGEEFNEVFHVLLVCFWEQ
jgi:hypothetical protein